MISIRKIFMGVLLAPFALAGTMGLAVASGAAGQDELQPRIEISGDYAVIERTRIVNGYESVSRITLPWDMYEQKFGYDPNYEQPAHLNDRFESIVPTPDPPHANGFNPGDTATLHRYATFQGDLYHRTTVYRMTTSGWGIQSNDVSIGGGGGGCGGIDEPPCDPQ